MNWTIKQLAAPNAHQLEFEIPNVRRAEAWVLLQSDEHWDNKLCKLDVLKEHHKLAKERNAPIFKFGDTFCAMQGKWDKRADQNQLREEHRGNNYLDKLVNTAAEWYAPYAENIALIGHGNHESSIAQRHQTCLLDRFAQKLKDKGSQVLIGGFWGFVKIGFRRCGFLDASKVLFYHHGYGGGGEVTRGLIDNSRTRGQYLADIYYSGHIHRANSDENILTCLSHNGDIQQREQIFLRGSTYKDEGKSVAGWHCSTGKAARPIGGYWLHLQYHRLEKSVNGAHAQITCTEIRAK